MWPAWKVNCRKGDTEQARGSCTDDEAASCAGRERVQMKFQHIGTVPEPEPRPTTSRANDEAGSCLAGSERGADGKSGSSTHNFWRLVGSVWEPDLQMTSLLCLI